MKQYLEPILLSAALIAMGVACGLWIRSPKAQFTQAECSSAPTGEKNVERYVSKIDGAPMLMQREVGAEWITVCAKREWR